MVAIKKALIVSDLQVPYDDEISVDALEQYMADERWDIYLNIGDFIDLDTLSSFSIGKPRQSENKRLKDEFAKANLILDRHQTIVQKRNSKAEFIYLEGNHEERIERFLDAFPTLEGILDIPELLRLEERKIKWVRSWSKGEVYRIGKATFTHGKHTGQYHAKKMVDDFGDSIFYGHTHDMMNIPRATKLHPDKLTVGQSIGCLCKDMPYMKGAPSKWQQGFMVMFILPDGSYTYYTPRIFNHQFVAPNGKLYKGREPKKNKDPLWQSLKR